MIGEWMVYALLIGLLIGGGTHLLEGGGVFSGWSRWLWAWAMTASLMVPVVVRIFGTVSLPPRRGGATGVEIGEIAAVWGSPGPLPVGLQGTSSWFAAAETWLLGGWMLLSAGLLALAVVSLGRLGRAARGWPEAEIAGEPVRISRVTGPAVFGFLRQTIVVPEWVLTASDADRRMIIAHEREHLRAGDHRLVLAAMTLLLLLPWNLPLWWMMRRLRQAVETDCDARVLASGEDPRAYGAVLLRVGSGRSGALLVGTALTEPSTNLERRIEMIARKTRVSASGLVLSGGAAALLLVAACAVDQPRSPTPTTPTEVDSETPAAARLAAQEPSFTPYDVRPEVVGAENARAIVSGHYPPVLRDAGIGGTAVLWVLIDRTGSVTRTRLVQGSGRVELDEAAAAAMRQFRFTPALSQGEPVPVWIQLPIRFAPRAEAGAVGAMSVAPDPAQAAPVTSPSAAPSPVATPAPATQRPSAVPPADATPRSAPVPTGQSSPTLPAAAPAPPASPEPEFTPYDRRPELLNRSEFGEAMERRYPPVLRAAGIGGTVVLGVNIDRDGKVAATRLARSSGQEELDAAANEVMRTARFAPAMLQEAPVPVWIQLPVTYQARPSS